MSGKNRVNPDHYKVAGRLSQDDLARERRQQAELLSGATRGKRDKPLPPWMLNDKPAGPDANEAETEDADARDEREARKPAAKPVAGPKPQARSVKAKSTAKAPAKSKAQVAAKSKAKAVAKSKAKAPAKSKAKPAPARAAKRSAKSAKKAPARKAAQKRPARSVKKGAKNKKKTR